MSRADDDTDDEGLEGLGSFRAMFRDIPDEEPPQRGLAELMAAARVKADEMAKPSLWERFLQTMRRPQVMALATIMILIGGAVFISQRKSEMDASPTASQAEYEGLEKNAAPQTVAPSAGSAMAVPANEEAAKTDSDKKEALDDTVGADRGIAAPVATPEPARDEMHAKGGPTAGAAMPSGDAKAVAPAPTQERKAATKTTKPMKAPAKPRPTSATKSSDGDLMLEGGLDDAPIAGSAPAPDPAPTEKPTPPTSQPGPSAATKQSTTQTVQQLHASAKKLAAAGDCAQVRTVAKQIAQKDAVYYRANIATDAALAGCLK